MRSLTAKLAVAIGLIATLSVAGLAGARANQEVSLDSGALGLTRAEVEANFGPGEPVTVTGKYVHDMYAYPAEEGTAYFAFQEINGEEFAVYAEFAWGGDGATEQAARSLIESFLPADAELTQLFVAPPTPDGELALETSEYESEALAARSEGILAPEILVISQARWGDPSVPDSTRVSAVSLMVRERTQMTG